MKAFEWILMEFMLGQPLGNKWRKLSMVAKSALVKKVAKFEIELLTAQLPSSGIGNIYFSPSYKQQSDHKEIKISLSRSTDQNQVKSRAFRLKAIQELYGNEEPDTDWVMYRVNSNQEVTSEKTSSPVEDEESLNTDLSARFRLGRIVSPEQFWGDHILTEIPRGPYRNSQEWLQVKLSLIRHDQERIIQKSEDEEEVEEATEIKRLAERLDSLLPSAFLHEKWKQTDVSMENILVDEEGEITAFVDWECVSTVPHWLSSQLPAFLVGTDRLSRPKREEYADESEDAAQEAAEEGVDNEGKSPLYWTHLLEYELTMLRQVYLKEIENSYPEWNTSKSMRGLAEFKLAVYQCATGFGLGIIQDWLDDWEGGNYWSLTERLQGMALGMELELD